MRTALFPFLLLVAACDPVEEDLPGQLAQVTVTGLGDNCAPSRFVGDAGTQFFGVRGDGGLVFTLAQRAHYSSDRDDGGVVESVQRQTFPTVGDGRVAVGSEGEPCVGTFSAWRSDGGLTLSITQGWPGADGCPSGPRWLPSTACTSQREFTFTPVGDCNLRCVRITAAGEVSCGC
jgi:hypothetical protein